MRVRRLFTVSPRTSPSRKSHEQRERTIHCLSGGRSRGADIKINDKSGGRISMRFSFHFLFSSSQSQFGSTSRRPQLFGARANQTRRLIKLINLQQIRLWTSLQIKDCLNEPGKFAKFNYRSIIARNEAAGANKVDWFHWQDKYSN